jgi:hypothetical protein
MFEKYQIFYLFPPLPPTPDGNLGGSIDKFWYNTTLYKHHLRQQSIAILKIRVFLYYGMETLDRNN